MDVSELAVHSRLLGNSHIQLKPTLPLMQITVTITFCACQLVSVIVHVALSVYHRLRF